MHRKRIILVALVLVVMHGISLVQAQDATPEPGIPDDNECNPGGVLYRAENQDGCPTEWYWKAGWYLAAVNDGRISRDDMPDEFASVLPPEDDSDLLVEPAIGSCWLHPSGGFAYQYVGPANTLNNMDGYMEGTCTSWAGTHFNLTALVFAHSQSEAEAVCATLGTVDLVAPFQGWAPSAPSYSYLCQVKGATS